MCISVDELLTEKATLLRQIGTLEREIRSLEMDVALGDTVDISHYIISEKIDINGAQESASVKQIEKLLKLSHLLFKIYFQRVEQHTITHNIHVLRGIASCGEIIFDFQVEIKKPLSIQNILLKLEDERLQDELNVFIRQCSKKKDFQSLMYGMAEYASLLARMKEILNWVNEVFPSHLRVEKEDLSGSIVRSVKLSGEDEPALTVQWKIRWMESDMMMSDRFVLSMDDADLFPERTLSKWKKFVTVKLYSEENLRNFWKEIVGELNVCNAE